MIRGTTNVGSTLLHYRERIAVWLRCKEVQRSNFLEEAVITINLGDDERSGRVQLQSMHPTRDIVLCYAVGEMLGGEHHRNMILDFAPMQDERFRISASEEALDAICEKTEILQQPASTPPD